MTNQFSFAKFSLLIAILISISSNSLSILTKAENVLTIDSNTDYRSNMVGGASTLINPNNCNSKWSEIKNFTIATSNSTNTSYKFTNKIKPIGNLSKFFGISVEGESRNTYLPDQNKTDTQLNSKLNYQIDLPSLFGIYNNAIDSKDQVPSQLTKMEGFLNFGLITKSDSLFFKLEEYKLIEPSKYNFGVGFANWYDTKSKSTLDNLGEPNEDDSKEIIELKNQMKAQQELQNELNNYNTNKLKSTKIQDVMLEETYKTIENAFCSTLETPTKSTSIFDLEEIAIGTGKQTLTATTTKLKPNMVSIVSDSIPTIILKLSEDKVFVEFVKKTNTEVEQITKKYSSRISSNSNLTPKQPSEPANVQKNINEFNQNLNKTKDQINNNIIIEGEFVSYSNANSILPIATSSNIKVKPTGKYEDNGIPTLDFAKLWHNQKLNEGLEIYSTNYEYRTGKEAKLVESTNDALPIEELSKAIVESEGYKKIMNIFLSNQRAK